MTTEFSGSDTSSMIKPDNPISRTFSVFATIFLFFAFQLQAQKGQTGNNFVTLRPGIPEQEVIGAAAQVTPSARQLAWQRLEATAFVHFGINTFYNQEWGQGTENPARFDPSLLNTDQWAKTISEAGLNMLIFTCKHHDGLCMWPSKYTSHTVAASPWLQGQGDLVKLVSESCRKYKLKFGIYLSPWDKHEASYGNSPEYNKFFLNQLTELLTQYGTIDEVWFDGACGEGPNGKKQVYDWAAYYALIRELQPEAVIAVMGPDVRWVGTESGYGRETEWSIVPYATADNEKTAANSQQSALNEGFTPTGDMMDPDLGSRNRIMGAQNLIWYPSEVDVSIRPGWFWHENENSRVKPPEKLLDIYFSSVGRNSLLLLNIPPDSSGLIHQSDIESLKAWKDAISNIFRDNFAVGASVHSSDGSININDLTDSNDTTSWNPVIHDSYSFEMKLKKVSDFDVLLLQENISQGQRIEQFRLDAWVDSSWKPIVEGSTVGYKRLLRFPSVHSEKLRFTIGRARLAPTLSEFGLFRQLPVVKANPSSASFKDSVQVMLLANEKEASVFYTTDGGIPNMASRKYMGPFYVTKTTQLNSIAMREDGTSGFLTKCTYRQAKFNLTLAQAPDEKYDGGGPLGLIDGATGTMGFDDGLWSGFNGTDLEAILDLGSVKELHEFGIHFLENTRSWIFGPRLVEFSVSDNGTTFSNIFIKSFETPQKDQEQLISVPFYYDCKARFVKVRAVNARKLPDWHPGKGEPAWLFVDEIIAR